MIAILLILALAGLVAIGVGASYLRGNRRPSVGGIGAWFATLQGPRLIGVVLIAGGGLAFLLALVLRS
ncbi:MAG TPA: hypothetical protein VF650_04740 [Allosphingosinicella sp.]